jgi:multidrug efflux pump subunit AcrA (membrane-fusion protein)
VRLDALCPLLLRAADAARRRRRRRRRGRRLLPLSLSLSSPLTTTPKHTPKQTPKQTQKHTALCQRTCDLEREADYEQRRAAHAEAVAATRQRSDAERQSGGRLSARLHELEAALASVDEQGAALQAARRELRRRETEEAPRKVHQISLYAHITRLAFSHSSGGGGGGGEKGGEKSGGGSGGGSASAAAAALQRGTVTDPRTGEVRSVEVDLRAPSEGGTETPFARANRVWAQL